MFASLTNVVPSNGEGGLASAGSLFPFSQPDGAATLADLLKAFPNLPPPVLVTIAIALHLTRTVTPFRLCECGCGAAVHGKARLDSAACRKRVQRERDAKAAGAPKQFNMPLQYEIPVTIPTGRR
jgi:hypothetical protein